MNDRHYSYKNAPVCGDDSDELTNNVFKTSCPKCQEKIDSSLGNPEGTLAGVKDNLDIEHVQYLRGLDIDGLASEWRSATLFPACPKHMDTVTAEFKQRGIAMGPVLDDYQRRLVEEEA